MSLLDIEPAPVRGVVAVPAQNCPHCDSPIAVYGRPGEGQPLDAFPAGYFCRGHAIRVTPAVHLHTPSSARPVCGAPIPADRHAGLTAYRSDITCEPCLATLA